jgi:hypothetical protein
MNRLDLAPPRFHWVMLPSLVLLALVALWTGFWFYAASVAQQTLDRWREQESRLGRVYTCGSQTSGGYPFRIEVRCADVTLEMRGATPAIVVTAKNLTTVAQVYEPSLLIAEITGPLIVSDPGGRNSFLATWDLAQASLRGKPSAPERISIAVDNLQVARGQEGRNGALASARHVEAHARADPTSTAQSAIVDLAIRLSGGTAPGAGPLTTLPLDAEMTAVLHGLRSFTPKALSAMLKDLQQGGGRLELSNARVQQGDTVVRANGSLALSGSGRLDGTILLTVAGLEKFIAAQGGVQKFLPGAGGAGRGPALSALDRYAPVLGQDARERVESSLIGLLGERTQLEGRPAVAVPLRFSDGAAFLGPVPLGRTPAIY